MMYIVPDSGKVCPFKAGDWVISKHPAYMPDNELFNVEYVPGMLEYDKKGWHSPETGFMIRREGDSPNRIFWEPWRYFKLAAPATSTAVAVQKIMKNLSNNGDTMEGLTNRLRQAVEDDELFGAILNLMDEAYKLGKNDK